MFLIGIKNREGFEASPARQFNPFTPTKKMQELVSCIFLIGIKNRKDSKPRLRSSLILSLRLKKMQELVSCNVFDWNKKQGGFEASPARHFNPLAV
ncbi:MAG: hypothetical protein CVU97_07215 [Firmicutes bacterium HGW-Firmicutes-21]|nr:MAG: hypothetical protein CVU97_07215 [Firmicutes bacterium HGW-Firmicutes-21]